MFNFEHDGVLYTAVFNSISSDYIVLSTGEVFRVTSWKHGPRGKLPEKISPPLWTIDPKKKFMSQIYELGAVVAKRLTFLWPGDETTNEEEGRLSKLNREGKKDEVSRLMKAASALDETARTPAMKKFQKLLRQYVANPKKYRLRQVPELIDIHK